MAEEGTKAMEYAGAHASIKYLQFLNDACIVCSSSCLPGFTGYRCERACPAGKFGLRCGNGCECGNGAICHAADGSCTCVGL